MGWSVILPESGTNKVLNPVGMGTGNTTDVATGAATTNTSYSYLGYKCFRLVNVADNDGAYWTLSALANAIHYVTVRINTASDISPMFDMSLNNATWNTPTLLGTEGDWWVYGYQVAGGRGKRKHDIVYSPEGRRDDKIYIGHIQVGPIPMPPRPSRGTEKGSRADGYYWNGTPHASSSTRAAKERSGGKVVDLRDDVQLQGLIRRRERNATDHPPHAGDGITTRRIIPGNEGRAANIRPGKHNEGEHGGNGSGSKEEFHQCKVNQDRVTQNSQ